MRINNKTPLNIQWPLIILAYLTLLSLALIDNARGPVYPNIIADLNISATRGSMLFAIASFSGLLTNITARWWLPYINAYWATLLSLFFLGIGSYLFAHTTSYGTWMLDISSFITGLGMGISNIGINLLVAKATPILQRRRFFAGLHSIYGIGSFASPLLLNLYLFYFLSWHTFFILLSIPPLFIMFSYFFGYRNKITSHENQHDKKLKAPCGLALRMAFALLFGFYVSSEIVVSSRLVYFLSFYDSIDLTQARYALSLFFLGLLAGRLAFAIFTIPLKSEALLIFSLLSTITLYLFSLWFNPLILAFSGLTMSYFFPVAMEWLSRIFGEHLEYMMASVMTGISITLVLMHLSFGIVTDLLGIQAAMAIFPILQAFCLVLILLLRKKLQSS